MKNYFLLIICLVVALPAFSQKQQQATQIQQPWANSANRHESYYLDTVKRIIVYIDSLKIKADTAAIIRRMPRSEPPYNYVLGWGDDEIVKYEIADRIILECYIIKVIW